ncbi:hypothetical protein N9L19_01040 [bacterium]|nr:hypothetical protein [bacterium]
MAIALRGVVLCRAVAGGGDGDVVDECTNNCVLSFASQPPLSFMPMMMMITIIVMVWVRDMLVVLVMVMAMVMVVAMVMAMATATVMVMTFAMGMAVIHYSTVEYNRTI